MYEFGLNYMKTQHSGHFGLTCTDTPCVTPRFSVRPDLRIRTGFRDARLRTGTLYLFFFPKPNWYLWVWPTLIIIQNIIYINRVPFSKTKLYFSNYKSEPGPTCSEPFQVWWLAVYGCLLMSSPVPTRIKNPC